jgi:hypothetical protein
MNRGMPKYGCCPSFQVKKGGFEMFCLKCGKQISESSAFCNKCGAKITNTETGNAVISTVTQEKIKSFFSEPKNVAISAICLIAIIFVGIMIKNYQDNRVYEQALRRIDTQNRSSNSGSNSTNRNADLFSQLSISNVTIRGETGVNRGTWSKVYAEVRNNGDATISGYLNAVVYKDGSILGSTLLPINTPGLPPGESTVVSGFIRDEEIQGYNDIRVFASALTVPRN